MDIELLLVKPDNQPIKLIHYDSITNEETPASVEAIREENGHCTFVFRDPSTFHHVFINEYGLIKGAKKLRFCIIHPLSGVNITPDEKTGGSGPNITELMTEWKLAFRAMPTNHQIKHIVFDMLCAQKLVIKHVIEVLREEKSVLKEKAAGSLLCTVQGYNDDDAMWV
ncbi:uncharacterized protein N7484_003993 [Penicillium longicatenatum]|uniref:uncharacterized protein n=1 Tax=Penicillium longicatenatum TaxID=1561947 RepID=UPI0025475AB4|nr:uncharacterized protein N7484_003993 [Penicillium longicatenatum]KAJ5650270.1 hypothetical protein N7484_003993 [Penicillium longicatenatum]